MLLFVSAGTATSLSKPQGKDGVKVKTEIKEEPGSNRHPNSSYSTGKDCIGHTDCTDTQASDRTTTFTAVTVKTENLEQSETTISLGLGIIHELPM
jgi:hypothetical protein